MELIHEAPEDVKDASGKDMLTNLAMTPNNVIKSLVKETEEENDVDEDDDDDDDDYEDDNDFEPFETSKKDFF